MLFLHSTWLWKTLHQIYNLLTQHCAASNLHSSSSKTLLAYHNTAVRSGWETGNITWRSPAITREVATLLLT